MPDGRTDSGGGRRRDGRDVQRRRTTTTTTAGRTIGWATDGRDERTEDDEGRTGGMDTRADGRKEE